MSRIRIGTRGSTLAMWQAKTVEARLKTSHPECEVERVVVKTTGDAIQDVPLSALPGKAFFTKEIEEALLENRIDLAVHSGKDVPTSLPDGLCLAGFMERHSPLDAWISREGIRFGKLPAQFRVGTSSLRRRALLAHLCPGVEITDLRGNVDTRLSKLKQGKYDAIILATAGLERLGLDDCITERLDPVAFPPAVSQGAIAIEIRCGDQELVSLLSPLIHRDTTLACQAERALLKELEGGCQVPLGALATLVERRLHLHASIISPDGQRRINGDITAAPEQAVKAGIDLAGRLVDQGGQEILKSIPVRT